MKGIDQHIEHRLKSSSLFCCIEFAQIPKKKMVTQLKERTESWHVVARGIIDIKREYRKKADQTGRNDPAGRKLE
jgi:hypothetical protein